MVIAGCQKSHNLSGQLPGYLVVAFSTLGFYSGATISYQLPADSLADRAGCSYLSACASAFLSCKGTQLVFSYLVC